MFQFQNYQASVSDQIVCFFLTTLIYKNERELQSPLVTRLVNKLVNKLNTPFICCICKLMCIQFQLHLSQYITNLKKFTN